MKVLRYLLPLLLSLPVWSQTSAFTATITDPDTQVWSNGTWKAQIYSPNGVPTSAGVPLTVAQSNVSGTMNGSGVMSGTLFDNSLLTPTGTLWRFTLCPNASAPCVIGLVSVVGATPSLSTSLSNLITTAPRFPAGQFAYGYRDAEVSPSPVPGATYYNVSTPAFRQWSGSAWATVGGGANLPDCTDTTGVSFECTVPIGAPSFNTNTGAILQQVATTAYNVLTFNNSGAAGVGNIGLVGNANAANDPNIYIDVPTGGKQTFRINGTVVASVSATGLQGTSTQDIPQLDTNTPTASQAVCIKAAGPPITLGTCSTVVSAGGACTCN